MFFYGHPQNRFWRVLAKIFSAEVPQTIDEKKNLLLNKQIALWDVIASCEIEGSSDSTIKSVAVNDLSPIFDKAEIRQVFVNGKTAEKYFNKYTKERIKRRAICLPSTSPANAAWSEERLADSWSIIKKYL